MAPLPLIALMWVFVGPLGWARSCGAPPGVREHVLAKVREHVLDALGPAPGPWLGEHPPHRGIHKRHAPAPQTARRGRVESLGEDASQVILFPSTDVPCDASQQDLQTPDQESLFTYLFQPSPHILSRLVTSAQLWFFTGTAAPSRPPLNVSASPAEVLVLTGQGHISIATTCVRVSEEWTAFHFAQPFLHYISQKIFLLLVQCPSCPCVSEPDKMPFIVSVTKPRPQDRSRRSSIPWSPTALNLLQRPSEDATSHAHCHRGSINISFEELGWDKWIVHPKSFLFHYCHGTCSDLHSLTHKLGIQLCCATLPSTMRSLRVRTTSDGGFSFKYETVPNIITEDCACT
ncbi:inhibin alpha chain [Ambystoma mexicanum]|uniref:inhibin alpha chain n=1 Tax=Ambystoma mexicanum TaxID=8296 RepID=UPI0037E88978